MFVIKSIGLLIVFIMCSYIGITYSKKFSNRVRDLEEIKNALYIFKAKIKYTYKPLSEIFCEISDEVNLNIAKIFKTTNKYLNNYIASEAWKKAVNECCNDVYFNKEDLQAICNLSKILGNSDLDGQINNIELTCSLIDIQLEKARKEEQKNTKLFKTLGAGIGLAIVIVLI